MDIEDNSFPAAPPCPQTPKPPNHQDTGNLKLFSHARPLKGRRIVINNNDNNDSTSNSGSNNDDNNDNNNDDNNNE